MRHESTKEGRKGLNKILVAAIAVIVVITILCASGLIRFENEPDDETNGSEPIVEEMASMSSSDFIITKDEWETLRKEVKQLQKEVNLLKQGNRKSAMMTQQSESTIRNTATSNDKPVYINDVTLANIRMTG